MTSEGFVNTFARWTTAGMDGDEGPNANVSGDVVSNVATMVTQGMEPARITTDYILKIIYLLIGVVGLLGNSLVMAVILNHRSMLKAFTNLYILNQSAIDGCASVILLLTTLLEDSGRYLQGAADDAFCKLWLTNWPLWGLLVSSSYNLVAMTVERYLAVVYPIWHKINMSHKKVIGSLVVAWFTGLFYQGAFKIPTTKIVSGKCLIFQKWPDQFTRQSVGVLTVIVQYFVPLILLCALYTRMALVIHRRVRPVDETGNKPEGGATGTGTAKGAATDKTSDSMARARKNVIKTLAIVSLCYILCWTCSQMYFFVFNLGKKLSLSSPFYHFTVIAVYVNSCINPFIYAAKYEQFQRGLRKLVQGVTCGRLGLKSGLPDGSTTGSIVTN